MRVEQGLTLLSAMQSNNSSASYRVDITAGLPLPNILWYPHLITFIILFPIFFLIIKIITVAFAVSTLIILICRIVIYLNNIFLHYFLLDNAERINSCEDKRGKQHPRNCLRNKLNSDYTVIKSRI